MHSSHADALTSFFFFFFFFNDTATTEIYTLSLHDALPIYAVLAIVSALLCIVWIAWTVNLNPHYLRSEEHTSELQSRLHLVCRLLLEKKKKKKKPISAPKLKNTQAPTLV